MPMDLKTRKYIQLAASLAYKKRQQASESLKLVGSLASQLLPEEAGPRGISGVEARVLPLKTEEELAKMQEERAQMLSPLEALQQEASSETTDGWEPFRPRSRL